MSNKVSETLAGEGRLVWIGDNNAEFEEDMRREGREAGACEQDERLRDIQRGHGLVRHGVGRPTFRDISEIDHITTAQGAAKWVDRAEWAPGLSEKDHGAVWARFVGKEREEGEEGERGEERRKGLYMGEEPPAREELEWFAARVAELEDEDFSEDSDSDSEWEYESFK